MFGCDLKPESNGMLCDWQYPPRAMDFHWKNKFWDYQVRHQIAIHLNRKYERWTISQDPSRRKEEKFCMCKCDFWKHVLYYTLYQVGFLICLNWVQLNISMLSKEMSRSLKIRNATKLNQIVDLCLAHSGQLMLAHQHFVDHLLRTQEEDLLVLMHHFSVLETVKDWRQVGWKYRQFSLVLAKYTSRLKSSLEINPPLTYTFLATLAVFQPRVK